MPKFPKNKSAFTLKSGNTTPFKQMGASQFTRSLQRRAFGTGTNPRDGAKMLNTSTWNYNKMKKDYERRLTKSESTVSADKSKTNVKQEVKQEVQTTKTNPYQGTFVYGDVVWRKNPTTNTFEYTYTSSGNLGQDTEGEVWYDDLDELNPETRIHGLATDPSYTTADLERALGESLKIE